MSAAGLSPAERWPHDLLAMASAELEGRFPKQTTAWLDFYGQAVIARLAWCGVVVVTSKLTGAVLVKSKPGQPTL